MKHKLHKMMAMLVAMSLFTMGAWAQEVYTSYIQNADLSKSSDSEKVWNTDGTKGISDGMVKVGSGYTFDFSQTITLPAGQNKMTAKAVYRYSGSEADEYAAIEAGTPTHLAKLYAETSSYKYEGDVMNRYDGASDTDLAGSGAVKVNEKYVPNSSDAVQAWFDKGQYVNELVFNVQEDGEVKIGIAKTESPAVGDYANIGAWTLTRLGDAEADPQPEPEPELEPDPEYPNDVTAQYLTNADFEQASPQNGNAINTPPGWTMKHETSGWLDGKTIAGSNDGSQCYNFWAGGITSLDMYQKVVLPAGKYTISAEFFYDVTTGGRTVYASVGGIVTESLGAVIDSWNTVSATFVNPIDGEVTLGIKSNGWFKVDNVRLEYLGYDLTEAKNNLTELVAVAQGLVAAGEVSPKAIESLEAAIAEAQSVAETKEAIGTATDKITAVIGEANATVAPHSALKSLIALCSEYANAEYSIAKSSDVLDTFNAAIQTANEAKGTADVEGLNAAYNTLESARQSYVQNATPIYPNIFDMTFLLSNSSFDSNDADWTKTGSVNWMGAGNMECYNNTFTFNRTLTALPVGVWTVSVDGFYRYGGYTAAAAAHKNGTEELHVVFYANGKEVALKSIMEGAGMAGTVGASTEDGHVPNAPADGNSYFPIGCYTNSVIAVVENGELVFGLKKEKKQDSDWTLFDNFKIFYMGEMPVDEALVAKKETFLAKYAQFEALTETLDYSWNAINENYYTVQGAALGVKDTIDNVTDVAVLENLMTEMDDVTAMLDELEVVAADYNYLKGLLEEVVGFSTMVNKEECVAAAAALDQYGAMFGYTASSVEAVKAAVADLKASYIQFVSNAKPAEGTMFDMTFFITNAEVASADGWTNANGRINAAVYEGAPDDKALDVGWWTSNIDINQVLPELPAGEYVLSAFARSNSPESYIYAKIGEEEVKVTLPQNGDQGGDFGNGWSKISTDTFTVAESNTLTIGVFFHNPGETFGAADNFALYYAGAEKPAEVEVAEVKVTTEAGETWGDLTEVNATLQLIATVTPENATDQTLTWTSSNPELVSVENGLITLLGECPEYTLVTITAKTSNGVSGTFEVNVMTQSAPVVGGVESIVFGSMQYELEGATGATLQLDYTVLPEDAEDKTITWTCSAWTELVTVSETGLVTIVGTVEDEGGMVTITATASNGVTATCYLTVTIVVDDTAIDNINANAETVIYDIHGRRVTEMTKGVYIVNGKKVVKK